MPNVRPYIMPSPKSLISVSLLTAAVFGSAGLADAGFARADVVAYLVNVTVRPGYNFACTARK